MDLVEQELL